MPLGIDQQAVTPGMVGMIVWSMANCRSGKKAAQNLEKTGHRILSESTVRTVGQRVGTELAALRDKPPSRLSKRLVPGSPEEPPRLAVVECDGGRMRTRQPNQGRGVLEPHWRETKNACLLRMTSKTFEEVTTCT